MCTPKKGTTAEKRAAVFDEVWELYAAAAGVQKFSEDPDRSHVGDRMKAWLIDNHDRMKAEVLKQ